MRHASPMLRPPSQTQARGPAGLSSWQVAGWRPAHSRLTTRTCQSTFPHSMEVFGPHGQQAAIGFLEHVDLGPTDRTGPQNTWSVGGRAREPAAPCCRRRPSSHAMPIRDAPMASAGHGDVDHRRPPPAEESPRQLGPQAPRAAGRPRLLIGFIEQEQPAGAASRPHARANPLALAAGRSRAAFLAQLTRAAAASSTAIEVAGDVAAFDARISIPRERLRATLRWGIERVALNTIAT